MASLDKIKQRMKTIDSTSKITKAMELVATAKLKRARENFEKAKEYQNFFQKTINNAFGNFKSKNKAFVETKGNCLWILLSSDLGLCGGYNINAFRFFLKEWNKNDQVIVIGQKGLTICRSFNIKYIEGYGQIINEFDFTLARAIIDKALEIYQNTTSLTKIKLVATKFINNASFEPEIINLLPFAKFGEPEKKMGKKAILKFEPDQETIAFKTLPIYLSYVLYGKVLEAKLIEQSSRRLAMESATKNAKEIIDDLKIEYNRQRQANITQEISEIIGGANS